MNQRLYIICIAAVLALGVFPTSGAPFLANRNSTATIHGVTYAWDTLEPLNDTVIDINSTPPQSIVAKNGSYSVELEPGDYLITAKYYQNSSLVYSVKKAIRIKDEGDYIFDLLLYPVSENPVKRTIAANMDNSDRTNFIEQIKTNSSIIYLLIALMFFLGGGYKLSTKHKKIEKDISHVEKLNTSGSNTCVEMKSQFTNTGETVSIAEPITEPVENSDIETADLKKIPLSADMLEVLDVIRSYNGRITQKELRSRLRYSEVKVSLMLSELERKGLIKKLKKGRENIVILTDFLC